MQSPSSSWGSGLILTGLLINPVIPASWEGYKVTRKFRGATYLIEISNPEHVTSGVREILLNGKALDGNMVPVCEPGSVNQVRVSMG